ncbi:MAG: trypco2 family protein [Anaerolineales bacterium]
MTDQLTKIVQEVKQAIGEVQSRIRGNGYQIAKIELELKTSLDYTGGAESPKIIGVVLSASAKHTDAQTIQLTLVPSKRPALEPRAETISEQLAKAITVISAAVKEAAASATALDLSEASVTLNFATDTQGKISVIVMAGMDFVSSHTIKLTLKPL